ncbi:MAG: PLP-dependent aminotransferase family protein [Treponema sp.]|nr:PLP-dependent aminotransferase family protein [Treponema sp.]
MITIDFEKKGNLSLTDFLFESIKNLISENKLKNQEKLPSKRALASHLGISVITVQNAYLRLIDEGYIYSIEKKGFFVSDFASQFHKSVEKKSEINYSVPESKKYFTDFASNSTSLEKFPFTLWSHTMRQVLNGQNENLLKRTNVFGSLELRKAICKYLSDFRNLEVNENQIIIGAGTESLYSMLVQFLGRNQRIAVENPGYHKAYEIFRLNGLECFPVDIDEKGIIVSELEKINANVVHVSPSHHFPTGIITDFKRRSELLDWAKKSEDRFIIEDDYDSEFRFAGKPLPILQSIDNFGKVVYINTFSKTLSPSFRISYMVLPERLVEAFAQKLGFYSCQVSSFEQLTLAKFIEDGFYEKHINKMKNYYRSLRNNLITALKKTELSKIAEIKEETAGLHFLLAIKSDFDEKTLQQRFRNCGINISLLSDYYYEKGDRPLEKGDRPLTVQSSLAGGDRPLEKISTFVINYSGIENSKISETVKRMCLAVFEK